MTPLWRYASTGLLIVLAAVAALWSFLDAAGHRSILAAAAIAWPVQVVALATLLHAKDEPSKFMVWWGLGILARVGIVIALGLGLSRFEGMQPAVLLLGVAGFFFGLLLLEPAFFNQPKESARFAR
jgi:hypothetical protein